MRPHIRHLLGRPVLGLATALITATTMAVVVLPTSASAATLDVVYTLEGCKDVAVFDENTVTCADSGYTTGNLGKDWSELDLVPFRVTLDNNGASSESGSFAVAGDYKNLSGDVGWDVISVLTKNTANSDAGCPNVTTGPTVITPSGDGVGGVDQTIYRLVTATIPAHTTCVYDYYMRLALGAHNFNGSNLQANLWSEDLDSGNVGQKRVPLPVAEIAPQELDKDMTATQDSDHVWDIVKSPTPASVTFADTCDPSASRQAAVSVTVTWTKQPASPSGPITVVTHVYATNPASRTITVHATDEIRSGTTVLDTAGASADVPANTTNFLLITHSTQVPAGTTDLNDVATATYTDTLTGIPIPGSTTATASAVVQQSGIELNQTAVINDVESIGGAGFSFSTDSVSGASGSFDGGYVAGTPTTGSVSWTSDSQSGSGSVTFNKTVYVDSGTSATGSLDDTATLTGSDGFSAHADGSVDLSSSASVSLTINKSIPDVLTGAETASFSFGVTGPNGFATTTPIDFGAGETSDSATLTGLAPGTYTVSETDVAPWDHQGDQQAVIDLPSCSGSVSFENDFPRASARARKVTLPAGAEAGWTFTLEGPGAPPGGESVITTGAGFVDFATVLQEGSYTITETAQAGYDPTGASADCSFTVDYPADAGRVYSCTITNTQRGSITVRKVTDPAGSPVLFTFTGDLSGAIGDGGTLTRSVAPGTYTTTETVPAGWDLTGISCTDGDSSGNINTAVATFRVEPGENVTCTYLNRERGKARVVKTVNNAPPSGSQSFTFQLRTGASVSSAGTILESGTANAATPTIDFSTFLVPGATYQLCEVVMPGWLTSLGPPFYSVYNPSGDNSTVCTDFTVSAGETKTFAIDNQPPPGGLARTIGFWKNWASCANSNGKQKPVLDETLAKGAILIGDLLVDTCTEAVRILDKSTVTTGKKMSSDPAFSLAAQLLAAKLNVQAGAGVCPAAVAAINDAQALLDAVDFDGNTHKKLTAAQASQANSLASTLDRYNNNKLC